MHGMQIFTAHNDELTGPFSAPPLLEHSIDKVQQISLPIHSTHTQTPNNSFEPIYRVA